MRPAAVKQAQEWLGNGDPATTLRHYVRLTTAARAKAVAGLDEVTRAAIEAAQIHQARHARALPGLFGWHDPIANVDATDGFTVD